jgi:hypothetical protein
MLTRRGSTIVFGVLSASFALAVACGGPSVTPVTIPSGPVTSASGSNGLSTTPPPSGLPPLAAMPPPGVTGSRKAKKKSDGALYACTEGKSAAKDPADLVKKTGEACAGASKMKALGAPFKGGLGDRDAHQEHKLKAEANKCYRVYFATDEGIKEAVAVLRDSAGDIIAESPGTALPQDGAICFTTSDEATLSIAIGSGKGSYVAQVWSN